MEGIKNLRNALDGCRGQGCDQLPVGHRGICQGGIWLNWGGRTARCALWVSGLQQTRRSINVRQRLLERCRALDCGGIPRRVLHYRRHRQNGVGFPYSKHRPAMRFTPHDKAWQRLVIRWLENAPGNGTRGAFCMSRSMARDWSAQIVEGATLNDLDPVSAGNLLARICRETP